MWETWADLVYPDCQDILDLLECNRDYYQSQIPFSPSLTEESKEQNEPNGSDTKPIKDSAADITITTSHTPSSDHNRFQFNLVLDEDAQNENVEDNETQPLQCDSSSSDSGVPSLKQQHIHFTYNMHEDIAEEASLDDTKV